MKSKKTKKQAAKKAPSKAAARNKKPAAKAASKKKATKPAPKTKLSKATTKPAPQKKAVKKPVMKKPLRKPPAKAVTRAPSPPTKKAKAATGSGVGRIAVKADKVLKVMTAKTTRLKQILTIADDQIWIENADGDINIENVPYTLVDGDIITTIDPDDVAGGPVVTQFTLDTDPPNDPVNGEPVINYDVEGTNDELEIDMSVIEVFDEEYDPNTTQPYQDDCVNPDIGIGING